MKSRIVHCHWIFCLASAALILSLGSPIYAQNGTTATPPPTNTPRATPTLVPTVTQTPMPPPAAIAGRLCETCNRIRLRATPGTAGEVLGFLDSTASITIRGRSADSAWLQVQVKVEENDTLGWVAAQYVRLANGQALDDATLDSLPILGVAVEAPPTPTSDVNGGNGVPGWLSGITAGTREIFLKGKSLGNRANVFSRVGDSISASAYFLTPIGRGQYSLGAYGYLSGVIEYFSQAEARVGNSFVSPPLAARDGWSAFNVLQTRTNADPLCGLDPYLVCEYNLVRPSVALIMFGTNDSGSGAPEQFEGNLRQIVQISVDHGVIPVLSTMPPRPIDANQISRVTIFNNVIRAVAQENGIPLWDYFAVMDKAPNGGLGLDNMHPSIPPGGATAYFTPANLQYGYTIRNLMALQVLDVLWREVLSQ